MITVYQAASYIFCRYERETGSVMDEMKLHKMLYFAQRESFVMTGDAMFPEQFEAWKYGPVMVELREKYRTKEFIDLKTLEADVAVQGYRSVFDFVFREYARKDSWSLSNMTHSQNSWKNARRGYSPDESCCVKMSLEDIRQDAKDVELYRFYIDKVIPMLRKAP